MMSAEFCAAVKEAGMTANVFYANTEADMRLYMDLGIDGILTDDPRRMKEVRGR
jgi:glycerophosphoryl diester phosphodiesterase